jgi:hypothetical protein
LIELNVQLRSNRSGSFSPGVSMVEAADARQDLDLGTGRGLGPGSTTGGSVAHRRVDLLRIVIVDALAEQTS